jgi:DNA-binding MarR family transcriptional regulator
VIISDTLSPQQDLISSTNSACTPSGHEEIPLNSLLTEVNALAIRLKQSGKPAASGRSDILGAEQAVLQIIDRMGALTVPQIALQRSTSRQNIQILVDRLATKGRVEFSENPAHKRSALVRLTETGKLSLVISDQGRKQLLARIDSSLSAIEISATVAVLRKIRSSLSDDRDNPGMSAPPLPQSSNKAHPKPVKKPAPANLSTEEFPVNLL